MNSIDAHKCVLCHKSYKSYKQLSYHYSIEHDEVYCARMSPHCSHEARSKPAVPAKYSNSQIIAYCYYCEQKIKTKNRNRLIDHFVQHTGEFIKECKRCNVPTSTCPCSKPKTRQLNKVRFDDKFYVFMCNLCNYTQSQENNLKSHIENMHNITEDIDSKYQQIFLCANIGRKNRINDSNSESDKSMEMSNQNATNPQNAFNEVNERVRLAILSKLQSRPEVGIKQELPDAATITNRGPGQIPSNSEMIQPKTEPINIEDDFDTRLTENAGNNEWNREQLPYVEETANTNVQASTSTSTENGLMIPNQSFDIKRIENIAFTKSQDENVYLCMVPLCNYISINDLSEFQNHLCGHSQTWSGECRLCNRQILSLKSEYSLLNEYDHMKNDHLPDFTTMTVDDAFNVLPNVTEIEHLQVATPMLRLRKIPGDMLSGFGAENDTAESKLWTDQESNLVPSHHENTEEQYFDPSFNLPINDYDDNTDLSFKYVPETDGYICGCTTDLGLCTFICRYLSDFLSHINLYHKLCSDFECPYCRKIIDISEVKVHMEIHNTMKLLKCPICKFVHHFAPTILTHIHDKHPNDQDKTFEIIDRTPKKLFQ